MLGVFDSSYESWATVLVLLIAARAVDAATGPLGEALLVGRRTWVDVGFVLGGVALAVILTVALKGSAGDGRDRNRRRGRLHCDQPGPIRVRSLDARGTWTAARAARSVPLRPGGVGDPGGRRGGRDLCLAWPPGQGGGVVLAAFAALCAALAIVGARAWSDSAGGSR